MSKIEEKHMSDREAAKILSNRVSNPPAAGGPGYHHPALRLLHEPAEALQKLRDIASAISGLLYEDPADRQKISALADEAFMVAAGALGEGPIPAPRDKT